MLSVSELIRQKWEVYRWLANDTKVFVRPSSGLKTFTGKLLDLEEFDAFWKKPAVCNAKPEDIVIIAPPQRIQGEWRIVADHAGQVVAYTTYLYQGNATHIPAAPSGAMELCKRILDSGLKLGPMFVLDIAQSPDGRFGLLEANAFSTAALYACKMEQIVQRAQVVLGDLALKKPVKHKSDEPVH
jgi:hypothetical protein